MVASTVEEDEMIKIDCGDLWQVRMMCTDAVCDAYEAQRPFCWLFTPEQVRMIARVL